VSISQCRAYWEGASSLLGGSLLPTGREPPPYWEGASSLVGGSLPPPAVISISNRLQARWGGDSFISK